MYNIWCKWQTLKTVMLGSLYDVSFYENIKNVRIKDALVKITEESQQELEYFEKVLKDFGCEVIRPILDKNERIEDHGDVTGIVPRPPLQPRDAQLVIGNELYYTNEDHPSIKEALDKYNPNFKNLYVDNNIKDKNTWAPSFTIVGKDIYYDSYINEKILNGDTFFDLQHEKLNDGVKKFRLHKLTIGGHNDAMFHTLKPGVILSLTNVQTYKETFPGWDVLFLKDQSWNKIGNFTKFKKLVRGSWWVPGEENNDDFRWFIESWLKDWVGYVEESVFDVNVLVLDENHVCVSSYNKEVFDFLKKHKIEPIIVPWRHRYFWDGGLHCLTLDLYREGNQIDYFPQRGDTEIIDQVTRDTPRFKMY